MNILVADDDATSRTILVTCLRRLGHAVVWLPDGDQAWDTFSQQQNQVIISDWVMPGMDGLELCRRIRAGGRSRHYHYFILLTGNRTTDANLRQAMDAGVDDFLTKPFDPDTIWMRLRVAQRILDYTAQIRQLGNLLPICSYCHKVRNDKDYWERIEHFMKAHTGAEFSHSICPECYETEVKPMLAKLKYRHEDSPAPPDTEA